MYDKKRYRPIRWDSAGRWQPTAFSHDRLADAQALNEKFGLGMSLERIILLWEDYSDSMAAGWLIPSKESVEYVFGVELEEVEE